MSLSIRDVQYFLAVAQHGRLSAAADELGITQPALTKAIRRVEAEFGMTLFERSPRGMKLSARGHRVLEQLRKLHSSYADAMHISNEMRAEHAGLLRIGITDTTPDSRLVAALAPLLERRPGLRVRFHFDRSDELAALVRDADLELALIPAYDQQALEVESTKVDNDPLLPLVRAGHPLAKLQRLTLADTTAFGWILGPAHSAATRAVVEVHARAQLPAPKVIVEVPFAAEVNLSLLANSDFLTLMPRSFLRHRKDGQFVELPIAALRVPRAVVLVSRRGASWSPLMTALRDGMLAARRPGPST